MVIDFKQALVDALKSPEVIEALRMSLREAEGDEVLVDTDKAAEILAMTPAALRKAVERGHIPAQRMGRRLRFRRDELLASAKR